MLGFDVHADGDRSTALFVAFHHRDGAVHDAGRFMAVVGQARRVRVPVRLALMAPEDIAAVTVGVMQHQPEAVLRLTGIHVSRPDLASPT